MVDPNSVGQDKPVKDITEAYDRAHGKPVSNTANLPEADRFQESTMPKGPDPSPFKLGPMGAGGR